jgi:hypothetical protein
MFQIFKSQISVFCGLQSAEKIFLIFFRHTVAIYNNAVIFAIPLEERGRKVKKVH